MRGKLFPTTVYLDPETRNKVNRLAVTTGKAKAVIAREALTAGLKLYKISSPKSANALLDLAIWAEENNITGPKDLSAHYDKYAWDEE